MTPLEGLIYKGTLLTTANWSNFWGEPSQICRCTHAQTTVLKYNPTHILVMMQESSAQGFCDILPKHMFESEELVNLKKKEKKS